MYIINLIKDLIRVHKMQKKVNKLGLNIKLRSNYLKPKDGYIWGGCKKK